MNQKTENDFKYYSSRSIALATFLGGPVAAGLLIRRNFVNNQDDQMGINALFISILVALFFIGISFLLSDHIFDSLLGFAIPSMYMSLSYMLVERYQGALLNTHTKKGVGIFFQPGKLPE